MKDIKFICCFTGHRSIPKDKIEALHRELERVLDILIRSGVREFRTGGALGFDTLAALAVLDRREVCPEISLELCLPCEDQTRGWSESDVEIYRSIRRSADKVTVLHERYVRGCMYERNRYMVKGSHYCIAYCEKDSGGSAYTMEYAKKSGVNVVNLALNI